MKFFFSGSSIEILKIFYDTEGNLQNHDYFNWHCIHGISKKDQRITFYNKEVIFVDSDHLKEKHYSNASHIIQLTDIIVGAVTYCIHETNLSNKSQYKIAEKMLPLVNGILTKPFEQNSSLGYYKKYDICHFPKDHLLYFNEERIQGEFYPLRCDSFWNRVSGQELLNFIY